MPEPHLVHKLRHTVGRGQIPRAPLVVPLSAGHQLPELASVRLGMPLHHRYKAGQLGGSAVEIQRGKRAREAADVEAPEWDTGQCGGQPRPQGAGQLAALGLLIAGPVDGRGVLTGVARPAEQRLLRGQVPGVRCRILLGITVLSGSAGAAVRKADIVPVDELAPVSLEAVHAELCEILPLGKPGLLCGRVGKIGDHGAGKPMPLRDGIGTSVRIADTEAPGGGICPVQLVLSIERLILPLLFVDGNLPQQEMNSLLMEPPHHAGGIRPGGIGKIKVLQPERAAIRPGRVARTPEDIKGGLVAPGLCHQGADRKAALFRLSRRAFYLLLAVPVVGGDPRPEGPFGRHFGRPEQGHVVPDDLSGRPRKQDQSAICGELCTDLVLSETEAGALIRGRIQAEARIRPEEWGGAVGLLSLEAEFLLHLVHRRAALLVHGVVFLAHSIGAVITQGGCQFSVFPHRIPVQGRAATRIGELQRKCLAGTQYLFHGLTP